MNWDSVPSSQINMNNSAAVNCIFSAIPFSINILFELLVDSRLTSMKIWDQPGEKIARILVAFVVICSDIPLVVNIFARGQLAVLCAQIVLFSSILLMNGNSETTGSEWVSIVPFVGSNTLLFLLFSTFTLSDSSTRGRIVLLVGSSCILAVVLWCEWLCVLRGVHNWQANVGRAVGKLRRAMWCDCAFFIHIVWTWALCIHFNVAPISVNNMITNLSYLQLIPILAVSLSTDLTLQEKASLTTSVVKSNRDFVRYVSHELRSHLSFLSFGLLQLRDWVSVDEQQSSLLADLLDQQCRCWMTSLSLIAFGTTPTSAPELWWM